MAGHGDGRKRFKVNFFHFVQFLLGSHHRLEHPFPLLEHRQFILTLPDLLLQRFHRREMLVIVPQVSDLLQRITHTLKLGDAEYLLQLTYRIIAIPGIPVHNLRSEQVNLLVMPQRPHGHSAQAGKLPDFQLVFTHNNSCTFVIRRQR